MTNEEKKRKHWNELGGSVRIVVDAANYNLENDSRFLIPFVNGLKWGAINKKGEVVILPRYDFVIIDPITCSGLVRVGIVRTFDNDYYTRDYAPYYRYRVGLFNSVGELILDIEYEGVTVSQDGKLLSVQNMEGHYGVLNLKGDIIVPFGKYSYIDGFDNGLARVKIGQLTNGVKNSGNKWGLINEEGVEVVPAIYDNIWNFYGKNRYSTRVEKDGKKSELYFHDLNPSLSVQNRITSHGSFNNNSRYREYAGSYAQDVMGYSDEVINDAFDGDPDAYWNID